MTLLLLLPWTILSACDAEAPEATPEAAAFTESATHVTFASLEALGSHRLDARIRTTVTIEGVPPRETEETFSLRWRDADHWQVSRRRDGVPVTDVVGWEGHAWTSTGGGTLVDQGDAEPYRADLSVGWDPWRRALGSRADQLSFRPLGTESIEGRPARLYAVESAQPEGGKGRRIERVEGRVWIDELTSVRLVGDVTLATDHRGRRQEVRLSFSVAGIGEDPGVSPPSGTP